MGSHECVDEARAGVSHATRAPTAVVRGVGVARVVPAAVSMAMRHLMGWPERCMLRLRYETRCDAAEVAAPATTPAAANTHTHTHTR